jgi:hypothetical protein
VAEIIEPNFNSSRHRGCRPGYPWEEWTDGKCRRVTKGVDFKCSRDGFISALYSHAKRHGLNVQVRRLGLDSVEFQFEAKNNA